MKRTNVMLDEELVEEACRITGQRTWSGVIDHALKEIVRRDKIQKLFDLAGTNWWQGDLAEMRGDDRPVEILESIAPFEQLLEFQKQKSQKPLKRSARTVTQPKATRNKRRT
jgi:Arc/MetJ family transcription regulator